MMLQKSLTPPVFTEKAKVLEVKLGADDHEAVVVLNVAPGAKFPSKLTLTTATTNARRFIVGKNVLVTLEPEGE